MFINWVVFLVGKFFFQVSHTNQAAQEILAYLLKNKRIDGNTMTVTGRTLGENLEMWTAKYGELSANQDLLRPLEDPVKATGHIRYVLSNSWVVFLIRLEFFAETWHLVVRSPRLLARKGSRLLGKLAVLIQKMTWFAPLKTASLRKAKRQSLS